VVTKIVIRQKFTPLRHEHNMTEEQESQGSEQSVPGDLVSQSLLSWAKDVRYVRQIQETLKSVFENYTLSPWVETQTWYMAYLLYVFAVVRRKDRSLGMEAAGLQFAPSRNRPILALAALGIASWALQNSLSRGDGSATPDELRGSDRQRRHELLRQQMLERSVAHSQISFPQPSSRNGETDGNSRSVAGNYQDRVISVLQDGFRALVRSFAQAAQYGPHTEVSSSDGSPPRSVPIFTWIFRLYTAQYLITGIYPTIMHRLLGLRHESHSKRKVTSIQPSGHGVVAFLIGLQGSATLLRIFLKAWTNSLALHLEKKNATNEICQISNPREPFSVSLCAICRSPRVRPAASRTCGHVFCWACLSHWVSAVKEACPYCRASCRLEDIQPLYNYDQPLRPVDRKDEESILRPETASES